MRCVAAPVWMLCLSFLCGMAFADEGGALKPTPSPYVKKATWPVSMIASLELAASQEVENIAPIPDMGKSDFTVMAWVKTKRGGTIFAKAPREGQWCSGGKTLFVRGGRLNYDVGWVGCVTGRQTVGDDQWHHVALAASDGGRNIKLYVDGVLDTKGDLNVNSDPENAVVKLGFTSDNFPSPSGMDGVIDELRFFTACLSDAEIKAYAETPGAEDNTTRGMIRHFSLESDAGTDSGCSCAGDLTGGEFVEGKIGKGLRFNAHGRLILPNDEADSVLAMIWANLERDFTDERSQEEMQWEREDGIWVGWASGDTPGLAARYNAVADQIAAAAARTPATEEDATWSDARDVYLKQRTLKRRDEILAAYNIAPLRASIEYLANESSKHLKYLDQLDALAGQMADAADLRVSDEELADMIEQLEDLRRQALVVDNPLLDFEELVFTRRMTYQSSHYYTDFIDGCRDFGGNICVLNLKTGEVRDLAPTMAHGIFGRYDVNYDAGKVAFDWKENSEVGFRIYEVNIDGTGLRQLTFPPADEEARVAKYSQFGSRPTNAGKPLTYRHFTDDMHPCYLPDGGIAFISTRCEYGILCDGPDLFTTTVLYRMDADGGNMEKLSNSSVSEATPSVTNDGRILYTRWEYVDKGAVSVKCLWAMNPDGSGSAEVYGNDIADPCTLLFGRPIPGDNNTFVCCGVPHCCPIPGVGTVLSIDTTKDIRTLEPLTYITPDIRISESGHNTVKHLRDGEWISDRDGPLYKDPYPLGDAQTGFGAGKYFLVAYNPTSPWNDSTAYGLYLLDEFGNNVPIYEEEESSCWQPFPLKTRKRPPVIASSRDPELEEKGLARVAVTDVYYGMEGVERGTIKYIRVNEQMPRPWAARRFWGGDVVDQQHACISWNTNLGLRVQHGVVPVEEDGSAYFLVPADANIFFQALDENFMEVQRERTFVNYRPGETRSCVGCHEKPGDIPTVAPSAAAPLAMRRPASIPGPQPGEVSGARPLHYPTDVQPILDKHCIECHGAGDQIDGDLDLTGTMTSCFSVSYENLLRRKLLPIIGENHPKWQNVEYLEPYSLGSHASKLIQLLRDGHEDVRLSQEEMIRLTTWVDANGQYYGSYYGRRNLQHKDHPNFRPTPTFKESLSTVAPLPDEER